MGNAFKPSNATQYVVEVERDMPDGWRSDFVVGGGARMWWPVGGGWERKVLAEGEGRGPVEATAVRLLRTHWMVVAACGDGWEGGKMKRGFEVFVYMESKYRIAFAFVLIVFRYVYLNFYGK